MNQEVNLKENIWIDGFDTNQQMYNFKDNICFAGEPVPYLWMGKTSEIPEDVAKLCIGYSAIMGFNQFDTWCCLHKYPRNYNTSVILKTAKESIQSACDKEYCIIYKQNNHEPKTT